MCCIGEKAIVFISLVTTTFFPSEQFNVKLNLRPLTIWLLFVLLVFSEQDVANVSLYLRGLKMDLLEIPVDTL